MTTPDGIPVIHLVSVARPCAHCGRTYRLLTDKRIRIGTALCARCLIALLPFVNR